MRQKIGRLAHIAVSKIDVEDAFRQVPVDPAGAPAFGYVVNDLAVVDFRLQFGWRSSPGFWGLMASALEHSHNHTTFRGAKGAKIPRAEKNAVAHDKVADHRPEIVVPIPFDCAKISGKGGGPGDTFIVLYYVDDGILVKVSEITEGIG